MNRKLTPRRLIVIFVVLGVLAVGGYYGARHWAWPAYKSWREARLNNKARELLAARDYENAMITVRRNLRDNQRNLESWRLAVEIAKAKGTSDVVYYQENVAKREKKLESQLELLRMAMQFGYYRNALEAVTTIHPDARTNPEFHRLAADLYRRIDRPLTAKNHFYSLIELRPDDRVAQLDLAEILMEADVGRKNSEIRQQITQLSADPALRTRALTALLRDAVSGKLRAEAVAIAEKLALSTDLTPAHRVLILESFMLGAPDRAETYRLQLEKDFSTDPVSAGGLISFYTQRGQAEKGKRWYESLDEKIREEPRVKNAVANAFFVLQDWNSLEKVVAGAQWREREFMRQAFISYLARRRSRTAESADAWKLATIQAGDNIRNTQELLDRVHAWGWDAEKFDLVWKLFGLMPRNEQVSQQLMAWERHRGNTANLNRLFARLSELNPGDKTMKNNFAYTSLLLESNLSQAYLIARDLHRAEPKNVYFATTHAFSLYRQGKPEEALALLNSLGPVALSDPDRGLHLAVCLAATGELARAANLIEGLPLARYLPEERKLLTQTTDLIARAEHTRGIDLQLSAARNRGEIDREKGWIRLLPEGAQKTATPDMERADSMFATGDMDALSNLLRSTSWGQNDHLRYALAAYADRAKGDAGQAINHWMSAMRSAGRDSNKLRALNVFASTWSWRDERMDTLDRLFERSPNDPQVLAELMEHHRAGRKTADLVRVLNAYISANPSATTELSQFAYYSMLAELNVSRAYVMAKNAFDAAPDQGANRIVYAFALWKQKRAEEAWQLLEQLPDGTTGFVPVELLRSAVLTDLGRKKDAARVLAEFKAEGALPEEASLAASLRRKLAEELRVSQR